MSQIISTPSQEVVTRPGEVDAFLRRARAERSVFSPTVAAEPRGKRAAEVVLVVTTMPVWLTVLGLLMLVVRLDSRGPAVFRQARLGRGGTTFTLYKLRSMVIDADDVLADHLGECEARLAEWHRTAKLRDDPRLTRLGGWLRRSSLDELPQLFNVLRGDMSLIGPRPIRAAERKLYGPVFAGYDRVRPGLSGLWQVSGRNDLTYAQRVALDRRYLATRSWWNELKIAARTVGAVVSRRGAY
ncbi:MAG: sugar transferase [Planctomycetota bacterium]